jgi:malate dehydrogenase
MERKVAVIGAGHVGECCALFIAQQNLADVVLFDIVEDMPQGKALDMMQARATLGIEANIVGTNSYDDIAGAEVVVITAGLPRKPGMTRLDLLQKNAAIIQNITQNLAQKAPDAIVIVVTNPIDVMVYYANRLSPAPPRKIFGQAGVLDSSRFACFIAMELGVSIQDVSAMVLGGHGPTMVPLPRFTTVQGVPITELIPPDRIEALVTRTREGGTEIVKLLKTGSAYYAPAAASAAMVASVLQDANHLFACSAYLDGQYGLRDIYVGVPVKLGKNGVEEIIELKLTDEEQQALHKSAEVYREGIAALPL